MRAAVNWRLVAWAVAAMVACSPQTDTADHTAKMNESSVRAGGGAGGAGGVGGAAGKAGSARAGSGGQPADSVVTAQSPAQAGALAVAAPQPMAAAPIASPAGPTAAVARIDPFMRKMTSASAGTLASAPAVSSGGAGGGGARPALGSMPANMQPPSAELCERLQKSSAMRPLPGNDRVLALLAACAVLQQPSAAGSASASGAGAGGTGGANAGDLPAGSSERDALVATAVFTPAADGIALLLVLDGCKDGALYPVHIHAGHSCTDESSIGDHWDRTRGDDIPDLRCNGSHAAQDYVRSHTADKPWTLGGPAVSDVIGHALVIGDPDDRSLPIACGVVIAP